MNGHPHFIADKIDTLIRFFLYVLIFWLPYGPAVVESCVISAFVFWVLKRAFLYYVVGSQSTTILGKIKEFLKAFKPRDSFLNQPIYFFLFVCIISILGSAFPEQALKGFTRKTLEWFVIYFLMVEVFAERRHILAFLSVFLVTSVATGFDSIIQFYLTYRDIFNGHLIEPGGRVTAGFKNPNLLAGYLAFLVPFSGCFLFYKFPKKYYTAVAALLFVFFGWCLFLTVSRAGWIAALCGIIFLLFFINRKYLVSGVLVFMLLAGGVYVSLPQEIKQETRINVESLRSTLWWRQGLWKDSLVMISDRPLFGHGINMYMRIFQEYRRKYIGTHDYDPTYAHNCFIQMAAETGVMGLAAFLWIIGRFFGKSFSVVREHAANQEKKVFLLALISGIFALLAHSFFDNDLYTLQLSAYFWIMVGVSAAYCHSISDNSDCPEQPLQ